MEESHLRFVEESLSAAEKVAENIRENEYPE